jgi:Tol biopolymer transport system component
MRFALPLAAGDELDSATIGQDIAISPDGKLIAYVGHTADSTTLQIHLRPIGELRGAPLRGGEGGMNPFFSPDGQSIGFVDAGDPRILRKVPASGGRAETIATLPASVTYVAGAAWASGEEIIVGTGQNGGLYRVPLDGTPPERITEGQHHWPSMVPDRDAVLLMDHTRGQHLAVLDLRTREVKALGLEGTSPRYVSTGHIVYATPDRSLWGVEFDTESLDVRGNPVLLQEGVAVKTATESAANFAISPAGHLAFASGGAATNLVTVTADGARSLLLRRDDWSAHPRFSPDGTRLAYVASSGDGSGNVDFWVLDLARGSQTRVTFGGDIGYVPVWTPDGKRLTHGFTGPTPMSSTLADGTGAADPLLVGDAAGLPTSWTPDGRTLAYDLPPQRTATSSWDVALLHVGGDGDRTEPFLQTTFVERGAIFSPDGRWVAYVSNKSGQSNVYARPFPEPATEITISSDGGSEPRWSPLGNEIYYRRGGDLLAVPIERSGLELALGQPRIALANAYPGEASAIGANYDISSKDGRIVLVEGAEGTDASPDRLYIVLNWLTELRARLSD